MELMYSTKHLIDTALQEDIGSGDITTENLVNEELAGSGIIVAKEPLVIAGLDIARAVFRRLDSNIEFTSDYSDGDNVKTGSTVLAMQGRLRPLLIGERTALNFLQHLSGIATNVQKYVKQIEHKNVRLVDTRKTTPCWRVMEKYAVRVGGAYNHRMGLYDGVLIKDNHIAACGGIAKAVRTVRGRISHLVKIEVEVIDIKGAEEAVAAGADVIMLDNMDTDQTRQAVKVINGRAIVEVSGNVTQKNLTALADTGVDIISAGALTHSAMSVDLSMRISQER
ncbi:MAG: nicotinate-nucleotide diphosphorylase (carboxylating) [Desulfobacteraceae bacterium 4572_123]|nr:MAG: nicotinate-nucleotide diphosphorylase (carboxylating) [Desulfobacteraceae bacterium 4572_123]